MDNKIIDIFDLPEKLVYLDVNTKFKDYLLQTARKYAGGSWIALARKSNLRIDRRGNCRILECIRAGKKFSLCFLNDIINYIKICGEDMEPEDIRKNVILLATSHNTRTKFGNCLLHPKLPFNFNTPSGAIVISALLHDGGINSGLLPHYNNSKVELRQKVYNAFIDVFGKIQNSMSDPLKNIQIYFPKIIGIILVYGLGMKYGRKTITDPSIPNFIFHSSNSIKSSFLQQAFDDEGYFSGKYVGIKLATHKRNSPPQLLLDLKALLKSLGIKVSGPYHREKYVTKGGEEGHKWEILIPRKEDIIKLRKNVGFYLQENNIELERRIRSIRFEVFSKKEVKQRMLQACIKIQKRNGFITSRDLAIEVNRTQFRTKQVIAKLVKEGHLILKSPKRGRLAAKYMIQKDELRVWENVDWKD